MPYIGQRSPYASVAPLRILPRHPQNEFVNLARSLRPASTPAGAPVVLLCYQLAIPAQDRVRSGDASEPQEHFAPEPPTTHREAPALRIGESDSLVAKLFPEHPVLLPQVIDSVFLLAVQPARRGKNEEL